MKIGFCLTKEILARCFRDADLNRLGGHDLAYAFAEDPSEIWQRWDQLVRGAEVLVTGWGTPPISDAMLRRCDKLKLIVHAAGSIRHLLPVSVLDHGLRVATANSALAVGVAETTLGMIISGLKAFDRCAQLTRSGGWKNGDVSTPGFRIREFFDVTVGLVGLGQVGRHLAHLLTAFEVNVLAYDPYAPATIGESLNVELVDLNELFRRSDVVSLHLPSLPETQRLISADLLSQMTDGAILINTARGAVVDESALISELRTGRISAILDVTDPEPPMADHPFRSLPNVMLTPHIAGSVSNGCFRQGRCAVDQILAFAAGRIIPGEVTAESLAIMA